MYEEVNKAAEAIKEGKIILYPTDTIWGIGCDATNPEAVKRVYELKQRVDSKALIVLVAEDWELQKYVQQVPEIAWDLVEFTEKPLTIIYPKGRNLAQNLLAEDGSIAIRMVKNQFCEALIKKARVPIVSTSANISGEPTAHTFSEIDERILSGVDLVVNWSQNEKKKSTPSTIMKVEVNGVFKFIRK